MKSHTYHLEFLTPCFCGGAEPSQAELRASALRGQLRWWFRCLGGTREEEADLFGSVHLGQAKASTLAIRIIDPPKGGLASWHEKLGTKEEHLLMYLLGFFAGRTKRIHPRGAIAPGAKAVVGVIVRRPPTPNLELALETFFSIGALGFRITRTAGAFCTNEHSLTSETWDRLVHTLHQRGFVVVLDPKPFSDWTTLASYAGGVLKQKLRSSREGGLGISAGMNGRSRNVLGSAVPRQASVVHLRPVRIDGTLRLAIIEAPHDRIVGEDARRAHAGRGSVLRMAQARRLGPPFS